MVIDAMFFGLVAGLSAATGALDNWRNSENIRDSRKAEPSHGRARGCVRCAQAPRQSDERMSKPVHVPISPTRTRNARSARDAVVRLGPGFSPRTQLQLIRVSSSSAACSGSSSITAPSPGTRRGVGWLGGPRARDRARHLQHVPRHRPSISLRGRNRSVLRGSTRDEPILVQVSHTGHSCMGKGI